MESSEYNISRTLWAVSMFHYDDAFRFKDKFDCWIEFEAKCLENIYLVKLHCTLNEAQSLHSYHYLTKFSHFLTEKHYYKTAIISIFCISHNDTFFAKTRLKILTIRAISPPFSVAVSRTRTHFIDWKTSTEKQSHSTGSLKFCSNMQRSRKRIF